MKPAGMGSGGLIASPADEKEIQLAHLVLDEALPHSDAEFPCSSAQERFWLLDRLEPGNPSYSVAVRWLLEGDIRTPLLEQAWLQIIERHEVLRTVFEERNGNLVQRVLPVSSFRLADIDLTEFAPDSRQAECDRIGLIEAREPFDLANGPLLRATLVRMTPASAILHVTTHQVVSDGWSIGVMARELGMIYEALCAGVEHSLPEVPIQYGDYARWQQEWLRARGTEAEEQYWSKQLAGVRPFQVTPDYPRPEVPTTNGAIASRILGRHVTDKAQTASAEAGATLFAAALAALCATLARYTRREEIVLGTQVSGRDQVELETMIGQFVNSLILRIPLAEDPSFLELMARVRSITSDALENRNIPIERLLGMVKAERDASGTAPISINFIFQRSFIENRNYGPMTLVDLPSLPAGAIYDLNFFMVERPDGWRLSCQYNTDQFDPDTANRLLRYCENVLARGIEQQQLPISELELADASDYTQGLRGPDLELPATSILQRIATQVETRGDHGAVTQLSYRQLDAHARTLARRLQERGVAPGAVVGICLDQSADVVVAMLSVLHAGAAYLLLDPADAPSYRRAALLATRAAAVIAPLAQGASFTPDGVECIDPVATTPGPRIQNPVTPPSSVPQETAFVMVEPARHQSGDQVQLTVTRISHAKLLNVLQSLQRSPGISEREVLLGTLPITHYAFHLQVWLPLVAGAHLSLMRADSLKGLRDLPLRGQPSILVGTTPTLARLRESGLRNTAALKLLCAGDPGIPLAVELLRMGEPWLMRGSVLAGCWAVTPYTPGALTGVVAPLGNEVLQLREQNGRAAPLGVTAELLVQGLLPGDSSKPVSTGELGRLRANGAIEVLKSQQRRVQGDHGAASPDSVESILLAHPAVREAAVLESAGVQGTLQAWVALQDSAKSAGAIEQLRSHLQERLPVWMVPASISVVAALPRTPGGYVDETALRKPLSSEATPGRARANPDVERRIRVIWAELLNVADIPDDGNFFLLGGHSLLAARMLTRVEAEFGRRITLATLFRAPTISGLAQALGTESRNFDFRQVVRLQPNGSRKPVIAINNTGVYYSLAKELGKDQPFASLQLLDPSLKARNIPATLEEFAAEYVTLIRRIQPKGPHLLVGWCAAGALCFEIARQLDAAGCGTAHLFLMDSWAPGYFQRLPKLRRLVALQSLRLANLRQDVRRWRRGTYSFIEFLGKRRSMQLLLRRLAGTMLARAEPSTKEAGKTPEAYDEWLLSYLQALTSRYEPRPFRGSIVLYRSHEEPTGLWFDRNAGWSEFAEGGIELVIVDGDHYTMFANPGVGQIAAHLAPLVHKLTGPESSG